MTTYVNLCKHEINLGDGRSFQPSGVVAEVEQRYTPFDSDGVCGMFFGKVQNVPGPEEDTLYIVPLVVSQAVPDRLDVVSPASNHPDCVRNEKGHIVSVPGFVK